MWPVSVKKLCAFCFCASAFVFLIMTFQVIEQLGKFEQNTLRQQLTRIQAIEDIRVQAIPHGSELQYPVVVWWSPLTGELGRLGECGQNRCFFTVNNIESLPLPRHEQHQWALFHEESPKNNYKLFHEPLITLFNHTATFSRHSHLPLTTQHLEGLSALTAQTHLLPLSYKNQLRKTLAPVVYVQSDCDPPSDRDVYIQELMQHIQVDSYGECLHNKDLPPHLRDSTAMDDQDFYQILAQYKFILAFENAVCDDYITEKLWRPLKLGVVPVYYGAPNVHMWLPDNRSAVVVNPNEPPKKLAQYLKRLDKNDWEYLKYLEWKHKREISNVNLVTELKERPWGVQDIGQDNFIDAFECMVCNRRIWRASYEQSKREAKALGLMLRRNRNFTVTQFWREVFTD
ncbi:Alpha-(1,3)-fucosyltransferase 10 [Labeo rohita]|uniref:Fucosyltransferase n=1 Tax=Labeo rohita TaxID=84645 RepID=A0ABQ8MB82_LABRO|nr:Alpha-(1,3)-fucosyltransferase 10 [Labeo rohita]